MNLNKNDRKKILPTNDYAFKKIFGDSDSDKIALNFINAATKMNFEKIKLDINPNLEGDVMSGKSGVTDIKAVLESRYENSDIDIEMQVAKEEDIADRLLWYWAKIYANSLNSGDEYKSSRKAICILIADFEIDKLMLLDEFVTRWHIREDSYKDIILTEKLYLVIIELRKLREKANINDYDNTLLNWCRFLNSPEDLEENIMSENENIKKAKEKLEKINSSEKEYWAAVARENALIREAHLKKDAAEHGKREGYDIGLKKGKKDGEIQKATQIAQLLKNKGMSIDEISEVTGVSKDEIEKI